jgi:hypothetical protein
MKIALFRESSPRLVSTEIQRSRDESVCYGVLPPGVVAAGSAFQNADDSPSERTWPVPRPRRIFCGDKCRVTSALARSILACSASLPFGRRLLRRAYPSALCPSDRQLQAMNADQQRNIAG